MSASVKVTATVMQGFSKAMEEQAARRMVIACERGLLQLESEIKLTLTGPRSGRIYPVPGTKGPTPHQAAGPGEPPAVLFGALLNSIVHSPAKRTRNRGAGGRFTGGVTVSGAVGVRAGSPAEKYAMRQEFGGLHRQSRDTLFPTMDGWRLVRAGTLIRTLPHPYIRPSVDRITPRVHAMWQGLFR